MTSGEGKTIRTVVERGLCTGCGTCAGLCPTSAIEMRVDTSKGVYYPALEQARCNDCGVCLEVCPGHEVDFVTLNRAVFGSPCQDPLMGTWLSCYIGHAVDRDVRYDSASGGLTTALLTFALEQGQIDGALVTRMRDDRPLEPMPFIARAREEIVSAARSKYCPVPANTALKEIATGKGRFAVVGLPCHIHGVRKAQATDKRLKGKVALCFGIFCSATRTFMASEYILRRQGIRPEEVVRFDHRGEGWPGQFTAVLRNGERRSFPFRDNYARLLRSFFIPTRCTLCCDHSCELADISFGEIGLPELRDDSVGTSLIVSRTEAGEHLLRQAAAAGVVELTPIGRDRVIDSKTGPFHRKKKNIVASFRVLRLRGRSVPQYDAWFLQPGFLAHVYALALYAEIFISSKRRLWWMISRLNRMLRWGSGVLGGEWD